jgi:3-methyladenine DNA glycosylase AlkC
MPEAFKNKFNLDSVRHMGECLAAHDEHFQLDSFIAAATKGIDSLELLQRSDQICEAMGSHLPLDYKLAIKIILASLSPVSLNQNTDSIIGAGISGWSILPINRFAGLNGLEHFDDSMRLLKEATKRFSSEFGIRYFLLHDEEACLRQLTEWASDENYHVRRLVSEGSRPRLPWAMQLPSFIEDPRPVVKILELLKDDPEEYVRRSVANNLNDIAKDHPDYVAEIAEKWLVDADANRIRLVKHACRTLLKQGHTKVMNAFGFAPVDTRDTSISIDTSKVIMGEEVTFTFSLNAARLGIKAAKTTRKLMIDYVVHHRKANGKTTPKVFKWKNVSQANGEALSFTKAHSFKAVTTRVYYPGEHFIEVMVNGVSAGKVSFELTAAN